MAEQIRAALIEVMQYQRLHLEQLAARHGLSAHLAVALLQLRSGGPPSAAQVEPACGDGVPMRELAGRIGCDPSHVTGMADRLEDLGLVERRANDQDRRVKLLVLTAEGERICDELSEDVNRGAPGVTALSVADQKVLLALLREVAAAARG